MSQHNSQNNIDFNTPVTLSGAGNVTASLSDYIIGVDNTAAARTVTLPTASNTGDTANRGKFYIIKDQSGLAGTNNITITPATGTIDGASSIAIIANFGEVGVYSDGSNWFSSGLSVGGPPFISITVKEFNATVTYTPTTGMLFCIVDLIGGGGGGGGAFPGTTSHVSAGGGGGSGGYVKALLTSAQIGASQAVTIGTGGAAGGTSGLGGSGVATSLGALLSATGGSGGDTNGGGGFPDTADIGGAGGTPTVTTGVDMGSATGGPGGNGTGSVSTGTGACSAGYGGEQRFGGGSAGVTIRVNTAGGSEVAGINGIANTGSGGTGAVSVGTGSLGRTGGAGASGVLLITEFINVP